MGVILNQPNSKNRKDNVKDQNKCCRGENVRLVAAEVRSRSFSVSL